MQIDRNSVIGFVLLAILFFGYFYFTRQGQIELEQKQKRIQDSLARIAPPRKDTAAKSPVVSADTTSNLAVSASGSLVQTGRGSESFDTLENEVMKIVFSNKGGQPALVELKKYLSFDSTPVRLVQPGFDRFAYRVRSEGAAEVSSADLYFTDGTVARQPDGTQSITYRVSDSAGRGITHRYSIKPNDHMIGFEIEAAGADKLFPAGKLDIRWQVESRQQERDIKSEKLETQVDLMETEGFDYFTLGSGVNETFENGVKWLGLKQKFFNSTIIAENGFVKADVQMTAPPDSTRIVASSIVNLQANVPAGSNARIPFRIYYGPNDFKTLKGYGLDMEDMVNLGQGAYAFVKYINRWIVLPFFNFIDGFVASYGLLIALLTIFIRLLTSPLVYTSYLSGAKMKALKPELDALREKLGDDQQAFSMEQMKLFRSAGVNPLGGCIPALLQIPIFFALYSFFNSNISLRGEGFWWSKDLSAYDSIVTWGMDIPFIGSHLSLFTILAVVTSLLISLYSMSMTPDQNNPMLKYMPYIFPVMLLGIFNSLPSALTWYYTVSNVITLLLQFVIQNYIIDHDKILAGIEENKKKPRTKSKWQERLEQMQETQKKVEDLKAKTKKK